MVGVDQDVTPFSSSTVTTTTVSTKSTTTRSTSKEFRNKLIHSLIHALFVYLTTTMRSTFGGFAKSIVWLVHRNGQSLGCLPLWEMCVKCISQEHDEEWLVRESNQESASFQSLALCSTTELLPLLLVELQ